MGSLIESPGMGICIFLKSISVLQYQNYISLKCFGLPRGFKGGPASFIIFLIIVN